MVPVLGQGIDAIEEGLAAVGLMDDEGNPTKMRKNAALYLAVLVYFDHFCILVLWKARFSAGITQCVFVLCLR